jgi:hypothetical protein
LTTEYLQHSNESYWALYQALIDADLTDLGTNLFKSGANPAPGELGASIIPGELRTISGTDISTW